MNLNHSPSRGRGFVATCTMCAVAAIASITSADATTWTNVRGGAWNDAANWSAGVPTSRHTAILPALRRGAYVIDLPVDISIASLVVEGVVTLAGASSLATGSADIGASAASNGSVTLSGIDLQISGLLRVGFGGGTGALTLADASAHVESGVMFVGTAGTGSIDLATSATMICSTLVLGAGSDLKLVVAPAMAPAIVTANLTRGGAIQVAFTPDVVIPILTPIPFITATNGIAFGDFASVDTPDYYGGQQPPVVEAPASVTIGYFNPIVEMWIEPTAPAAYLGFVEEVKLHVKRISGAMGISTMWATWSVEPPEIAYVDGPGISRWLHPVQSGSAVLTASLPQYGATLVTTRQLTVLPEAGQVYEAIDVGSNGEQTNGAVYGGIGSNGIATTVRCSVDGRYVVFANSSTTFGPDPSPGKPDVYVKDRATGALELVSGEMAPDAYKLDVDISADGRFVTFAVQPDPEGLEFTQLWLHDRQLGTTTLVSRTPTSLPANGDSYTGRISGDGSTIAFRSTATDLGPRDDNGVADIYAYDIATGAITLVSVDANGGAAALDCDSPAISGDGRVVAFTSLSDFGLALPSFRRVWLKDRVTGAIELVSVSTSGVPSNGLSRSPAMDASGNIVVFRSTSSTLVPGSPAGHKICLRDRAAGTTSVVPLILEDGYYYCGGEQQMPVVSADGRFVAVEMFESEEPPYLGSCAIVRVDLATGQVAYIAETPSGEAGKGYVTQPALRGDGSEAFFAGQPKTFMPFATDNLTSDLFARTFGGVSSADLDRDGIVGALDLAILLGAWGSTNPGDLDGDGIVGPADIAVLLGAWTVD